MNEEVFTGNTDELLEHVEDNHDILVNAREAEMLKQLTEELNRMIEDGVLEKEDGKYKQNPNE
jgi:division protein CdvB (Snf7/Vps24/ESCRT-III family)